MALVLRRLRRSHMGVLRFGDVFEIVRFVLDPASGQPVLPVVGHALDFDSVLLCTPDDAHANPDCLQVTANPVEIDPLRDEACDRHGAYFGRPAHTRWARLEVESIKRLDEVLDGDLVRLANPLRRHEGRLCQAANKHEAAIARACERSQGITPESPRVVGVDPWGMDVRARFDVLRIEFDEPASTPDEGRDRLSRVLGVTIDTGPMPGGAAA